MTGKNSRVVLAFHPLTVDRLGDFEHLFGPRGACGGCWCMLWRLSRKQFESQTGEQNRRSMLELVHSGTVPGLLAYHGDEPVGWCALAPRDHYPALARSRVLKPVDEQPCWSVACLFVRRDHRKQSVATQLLTAATRYARSQGATVLEGYPVEPKEKEKEVPPAFAWTGIPRAFHRAGFRECARRSPTRPIMRIALSPAPWEPESDRSTISQP